MIELITFKKIKDARGNLIPIEHNELPFKIKRTYILNSMPKNAERAGHAHKKLNQILFCLSGKIKIKYSNLKKNKSLILSDKTKAVWMKPGVWREIINLSKNTVVMVLASDKFNENDYIRSYNDFIKYKKNENKIFRFKKNK